LDSYNFDVAKKYFDSNQNAISEIKNIIEKENIDCDYMPQSSYIYTKRREYIEKLKDEVQILKTLGANSSFVTSSPLPFNILGAAKLDGQAQFHPRKYVFSLLNLIQKNNGKIYANTKAIDIKNKLNKYDVICDNYKISAKYVIIATHYPIKNFPGLYFLKMYQDKSYIIAVDPHKEIFDGMYLSAEEPVTSFRNIGKKLLLVGGSGHKTGANNIDLDKSYTNLENYIKSIYPNAEIKYKWSTEDCVTLDKIPYIGNFSNLLPNIFVATGFKKWGMTTSFVAAKIISDKILKKHNPYENIYKATRLNLIKNRKEFKNITKQTAYSLVINRLKMPKELYSNIQNNCGGVVNFNGKKIGIYKNHDGKIFAVKPYCSHLGCELSWNNLEKTWDCPCHGSRYDYTGKLITEPSTKNLKRIQTE